MLVEGCKHEIEITVPVDEIDRETERVVTGLQQKVRLPGFRPGKAPANIIRTKFSSQVREDVIESLVPKYFRKKMDEDSLEVVGKPTVKEVDFEPGQPLRFKAEFEVAPVIELGEYRGVAVHYHDPEVKEEDVAARLESIREQKAEYINEEPRPVKDGDYAMVSLESISGAPDPIKQDEMMLHVGDADTMPAFTEALLGMSPDEEKEFDITYPEDYGQDKLAGKTVHFRMKLKTIRLKELPELNDEFARDLGDYSSVEELSSAVNKAIFREKEYEAQQAAKKEIVEKLVETHTFPIPEAYIDRQIEVRLENQLRELSGHGIDPRELKIDWLKLKDAQRDKAVQEVKSSLIIDKIAQREGIDTTRDELDREIQRIAKQEHEPVAAMRKKMEKNGMLGRIAYHIRGEKTLNFLFEHARKEA